MMDFNNIGKVIQEEIAIIPVFFQLAPERQTYPYIVYSIIADLPFGTFCKKYNKPIVQVAIHCDIQKDNIFDFSTAVMETLENVNNKEVRFNYLSSTSLPKQRELPNVSTMILQFEAWEDEIIYESSSSNSESSESSSSTVNSTLSESIISSINYSSSSSSSSSSNSSSSSSSYTSFESSFNGVYLMAGGFRSDNVTSVLYDAETGDELATIDFGEFFDTKDVFIDKDGNFYEAANTRVRKYNKNLDVVWEYNHGGQIQTIWVDNSLNVYIGGVTNASSGNMSHRKLNSSGNVIWSANHGQVVNGICADSSGNCYITGNRLTVPIGSPPTPVGTTRKYGTSGNLIWSFDGVVNTNCIGIDSDDNIYIGGSLTTNITTRKLRSSDGAIIWNRNHGATVRGICVDKDGFVYTTGDNIGGINTRKLQNNGSEVWARNYQNNLHIDIDNDYNIYTAGSLSNGARLSKYDADGNLIYRKVGFGTFMDVCVAK
jgi:streptogramin lyase